MLLPDSVKDSRVVRDGQYIHPTEGLLLVREWRCETL